jgi:hypothetical protein
VLVQSVVKARRAIGDNGHEQRYIKTVTGYGYRFIAPVEEHQAVSHEAPVRVPIPVWPEAHSMVLPRAMAPRHEEAELVLQELPLASRGQELALLHRLLEQAKDGQERVVLLVLRLPVPPATRAKRSTQLVNAVSHALQSYATELVG